MIMSRRIGTKNRTAAFELLLKILATLPTIPRTDWKTCNTTSHNDVKGMCTDDDVLAVILRSKPLLIDIWP